MSQFPVLFCPEGNSHLAGCLLCIKGIICVNTHGVGGGVRWKEGYLFRMQIPECRGHLLKSAWGSAFGTIAPRDSCAFV